MLLSFHREDSTVRKILLASGLFATSPDSLKLPARSG
jgi:hypothetical protein